MPKRKRTKDVEDDLATLIKKIKKIERKIRRKRSSVSNSDSEDTPAGHLTMRSTIHRPESPQSILEPDDWHPETSDHAVVDDYADYSVPELVNVTTDMPTTSSHGEIVSAPAMDMPPDDSASLPVEPQKLDEEILEILGEEPTTETKYGNDIRAELASRLQHIAREGINKVNRKELMAKYPVPANCLHISAPQLNAEIKAALPEPALKRDKGIEAKQNEMSCAISCLADVITTKLNSKEKNNEVLQKLMDLSRMLCDIQHGDSATRRNFILTALKKDVKEHMTNTKIDTFLFGEKLSETIKSAKAVTKSGAELKADFGAKNSAKKSNTSGPRALNRKTPAPARRPPNAPQRSREPAAPRAPPLTHYRAPWQPLPPPPPPPPQPAPQALPAAPRRRH